MTFIPKSAVTHSALDGALTFVMLPYRNITATILTSDMKAKYGEAWIPEMYAFCALLGATLDVQYTGTDNPAINTLVEFWEASRQMTTAEKWDAFSTIGTTETLNLWWEAYDATRQKVIPAPEILQGGEPTDPNSGGSGGNLTSENS